MSEKLTFEEYKNLAITTKIYPPELGIYYTTLGLVGEAGEVAEKVKKVIRDKKGVFDKQDIDLLEKELGDVLWYLAALADELGIPFEQIGINNIYKLQKRKDDGTLGGSGDLR